MNCMVKCHICKKGYYREDMYKKHTCKFCRAETLKRLSEERKGKESLAYTVTSITQLAFIKIPRKRKEKKIHICIKCGTVILTRGLKYCLECQPELSKIMKGEKYVENYINYVNY